MLGWEKVRKQQELEENLEAVRSQLRLAKTRLQQWREQRPPIGLASAVWGEGELELFRALLKNSDFQGKSLADMRKLAGQQPLRKSAILSELQDIDLGLTGRPDLPQWIKDVCNNREHFQHTAFVVGLPDGHEEIWAFQFAVKSPQYLGVRRCTPLDIWHDYTEPVGWSEISRFEMQYVAASFLSDWSSHQDASEVIMASVHEIKLLQDVQAKSGAEKFTSVPPVPLHDFLCRIANPEPARQGGGRIPARHLHDDPPWLQDLETKGRELIPRMPGRVRSQAAADEDEEPGVPEENVVIDHDHDDDNHAEEPEANSDADVEELLMELEASRRDAENSNQDVINEDFGIFLGTRRSALDVGQAVSNVQGFARHAHSQEWCRKHAADGVQMSFDCTVAHIGDLETCHILCRNWVHKMRYFIAFSYANGMDSPITQRMRDDYREDPSLQELQDASVGVQPVLRRIRQIRRILS